jgi:hypothetical protein
MKRLVLALSALVAGVSGCASPAQYVERTGDTGVVAIPAPTDSFPTYYRSEALALIQKHVGPNFEIVSEQRVATGTRTLNDQQVNNEQTWNTSNPLLPAARQTVQNTTTTQDVTEWRIAYRKKGSGQPGSPGGLMPAGGIQPPKPPVGAEAPVQPAGGIVPPVGPLSSAAPQGPLAPTGGPGVYGSASAVLGQMK